MERMGWGGKVKKQKLLNRRWLYKDIDKVNTKSDWFQNKQESRCSAHIPPTVSDVIFLEVTFPTFTCSRSFCWPMLFSLRLSFTNTISPLRMSLRSSLLCLACLMWRWKCRRGHRTDLRCCCGPHRVRFVLRKPWSEVIAVPWINTDNGRFVSLLVLALVLSSHKATKLCFLRKGGFTMAVRDVLHNLAMDWYCRVCVASRGV